MAFPAVDADGSSHHLDQLLADRQAEPGAAVLARGGSVGLHEGREQRRDLIRPYPDSRIGDGEAKGCRAVLLPFERRIQRHFSPFSELDGIGGKIGQHLAQAVGIAAQQRRNFRRHARNEAEPLALAWTRKKLNGVLDRLAQIEVQMLQSDLLGLDLGKVQNVIDKSQQGPPAVLRHCGVSPLLRSEVRFPEQLKHANDAVHRRADFVAHVGQKAALRPIGGFRALAGANQLRLVSFPLGNLLRNSSHSNQLAGLVADGKSPVPNPFLLPFRRSDAVFRVDLLSLYLSCKQ